jgi:hypothetical protein
MSVNSWKAVKQLWHVAKYLNPTLLLLLTSVRSTPTCCSTTNPSHSHQSPQNTVRLRRVPQESYTVMRTFLASLFWDRNASKTNHTHLNESMYISTYWLPSSRKSRSLYPKQLLWKTPKSKPEEITIIKSKCYFSTTNSFRWARYLSLMLFPLVCGELGKKKIMSSVEVLVPP